jgi:hypothetical protein
MTAVRSALAILIHATTPEGTVLAWQPDGQEGPLIADIDTAAATGRLAVRCRMEPSSA